MNGYKQSRKFDEFKGKTCDASDPHPFSKDGAWREWGEKLFFRFFPSSTNILEP